MIVITAPKRSTSSLPDIRGSSQRVYTYIKLVHMSGVPWDIFHSKGLGRLVLGGGIEACSVPALLFGWRSSSSSFTYPCCFEDFERRSPVNPKPRTLNPEP